MRANKIFWDHIPSAPKWGTYIKSAPLWGTWNVISKNFVCSHILDSPPYKPNLYAWKISKSFTYRVKNESDFKIAILSFRAYFCRGYGKALIYIRVCQKSIFLSNQFSQVGYVWEYVSGCTTFFFRIFEQKLS